MKYCLKCGFIVADNSIFKDKDYCGNCKILFEEDDMTSERFNALSEQQKEEYTQSLYNKIKNSDVFDQSLCKYGEPKFYISYWFDKYESLTGDVADRCGDDLKQHMQSIYGKGSKLYEEQVIKNHINAERVRKEESTNIPKCPTCQSTNIKSISGLNRGVSVAMLGIFSKKINKSFECKNCGYTW